MKTIGITALAMLAAASALSAQAGVTKLSDAEVQARKAWRETMLRTPAPTEACFHAAFPNTVWERVACTVAPNRPYVPRTQGRAQIVGDGIDYVAEVSGLTASAVGTFPVVSGVTSETDGVRPNVYSLQMNSNFMNTAVCNGISGCLSWEQFVYSSSERAAFMQYWLINYGTCPAGWNTYGQDCYKNSAAARVPKEDISELANLKLSGSAVDGGLDTLVFATDTDAYSTSGQDSVVYLATGWTDTEFNIVGDGGGSSATFNKGSTIAVQIAVDDGTHNAPACVPNSGTTGETNNLRLKGCVATGGSSPAVQFVESN